MYSDPIGAASGQPVREGVAILREPTAGECDGAVFRQRVRVEEHPGLAIKAILYV